MKLQQQIISTDSSLARYGLSSQNRTRFNVKRANFQQMNEYFASIHFDDIFANKPLAEISSFDRVISKAIQYSVPTYVKKNSKKCPWKTDGLIIFKNRKRKAWDYYKFDKKTRLDQFNANLQCMLVENTHRFIINLQLRLTNNDCLN